MSWLQPNSLRDVSPQFFPIYIYIFSHGDDEFYFYFFLWGNFFSTIESLDTQAQTEMETESILETEEKIIKKERGKILYLNRTTRRSLCYITQFISFVFPMLSRTHFVLFSSLLEFFLFSGCSFCFLEFIAHDGKFSKNDTLFHDLLRNFSLHPRLLKGYSYKEIFVGKVITSRSFRQFPITEIILKTQKLSTRVQVEKIADNVFKIHFDNKKDENFVIRKGPNLYMELYWFLRNRWRTQPSKISHLTPQFSMFRSMCCLQFSSMKIQLRGQAARLGSFTHILSIVIVYQSQIHLYQGRYRSGLSNPSGFFLEHD